MTALGINLIGLITQVVGFVAIVVLLTWLLYKPLLRVLDQRSERIRESLEASERAREEAARSQEEMQRQIEESRAEGQQLIAQARDVADRFREEELAKARDEIARPEVQSRSRHPTRARRRYRGHTAGVRRPGGGGC